VEATRESGGGTGRRARAKGRAWPLERATRAGGVRVRVRAALGKRRRGRARDRMGRGGYRLAASRRRLAKSRAAASKKLPAPVSSGGDSENDGLKVGRRRPRRLRFPVKMHAQTMSNPSVNASRRAFKHHSREAPRRRRAGSRSPARWTKCGRECATGGFSVARGTRGTLRPRPPTRAGRTHPRARARTTTTTISPRPTRTPRFRRAPPAASAPTRRRARDPHA
jgi:hypothetical protein